MSHCSISVFSLVEYCMKLWSDFVLAVVPLATHLSLGEQRLRQLDHVTLKLGSLRVGLLQKRSGLVVEGSHGAHVGDC
jgi:hypothetical protein